MPVIPLNGALVVAEGVKAKRQPREDYLTRCKELDQKVARANIASEA
jgi:hypothetical protein